MILPAKVKKPRFKPSVEGAVGILEKGLFHVLEERRYFWLNEFNDDLWEELDKLNDAPFKKKEHCRTRLLLGEEKEELMPLPSAQYRVHGEERSKGIKRPPRTL